MLPTFLRPKNSYVFSYEKKELMQFSRKTVLKLKYVYRKPVNMYRKTRKYTFSSQNFDVKIAKSTTLPWPSDTPHQQQRHPQCFNIFCAWQALINNKREEDLCLKGLQNSRQ